MTDTRVPETIYRQLGGGRFATMTGSKNFIFSEKRLSMRLVRNKSKANLLEITLAPDDTYTMEFRRYVPGCFYSINNGTGYRERKEVDVCISRHDGVYWDMLEDIFTQVTGLYTRL